MKKMQNGFTVVEGLLILVIVGIIGATGWYVWSSKNQADKNLNAANSTKLANQPLKTIKSFDDCKKAKGSKIQETFPEVCVTKDGKKFTQSVAATPKKYFTIKEWGVRAQNTGSLTFLYSIKSDQTGTWAYVTSQQVVSLDPANCGIDSGLGGVITRAKPGDAFFSPEGMDTNQTVEQALKTNSNATYKLVNGYYYWYNGPQAYCGTSQSDHDTQQQTKDSVKALIPNLETVPSTN